MTSVPAATLDLDPGRGWRGRPSAYAACLEPLLGALRWRGTERRRIEAATHGCADLLDLRNTMSNLDYVSRSETCSLETIDVRLLPCLFVPADGDPIVVLGVGEGPETLRCFKGASGQSEQVKRSKQSGTAYFFTLEEPPKGAEGSSWLRLLFYRFEPALLQALGLSFVTSLLGLVPAFFVLAVYDTVLASRNYETLGYFAAGVLFVLLCDLLLRVLRGAILARVGARIDFLTGNAVVRKLLSLPLLNLEKSSLSGQIARLREIDGLRNAFTGPAAAAMLELPFSVIYVIAIAAIGGWLALVPVVVAVILLGAGLLAVRYAHDVSVRAIATNNDQQSLLIETLANLPSIKAAGSETIWLERLRERSARTALDNLKRSRISALAEAFSFSANLISGAATLAAGTLLALNGAITVGALIASMALVWRMLVPIQAWFMALTRVDEVRGAARSVNQLMAMPTEGLVQGVGAYLGGAPRFAGRIELDKVVFRYAPHHEPALAGISIDVEPGQIVAITGGNGCGKSTLLKLIEGLYTPQLGSIRIDGMDIRQFDPIDLRHSIGVLPQKQHLFLGSIADNLRFASPEATDEDLRDAANSAGVLEQIEELPAGFDTPVDDRLSENFVQRLTWVRSVLVDANILLLDEPHVMLDRNGKDLLIGELYRMRGVRTVLMATHHAKHVQAADRVIVLRRGAIAYDGPPGSLMNKLAKGVRQ